MGEGSSLLRGRKLKKSLTWSRASTSFSNALWATPVQVKKMCQKYICYFSYWPISIKISNNMIRVLAFFSWQFLFTIICIQITGTNYLSYSMFHYIQLAHYFLWLITYWYAYTCINLIKLQIILYLFHGDKFSIHSYTNI